MPLHCISFSTISAALTRRSELPRAMAAGLVETVMNMTDVVDLIDADPTRKRLLKFQTETPPTALWLCLLHHPQSVTLLQPWRGLSPMCPALQSIELAFVRHRAVPAQCIR